MIYITSAAAAAVMSILLFVYMTKKGYFSLADQATVMPPTEEAHAKDKEEHDNSGNESKESFEELGVYRRKASFTITAVFFVVTFFVSYLLYIYTMYI